MKRKSILPIPDDDELYRRIVPLHYKEKEDRPSSAAFSNYKLSVNWATHTTPKLTLQNQPDSVRLASIISRIPRLKMLKVEHDPLDDNFSHSLIIGKKTKSKKKFLARNCKWV